MTHIRKPYRFLLASSMAALPSLGMLVILAVLFGYVPVQSSNLLGDDGAAQGYILLTAATYCMLVILIYALARMLWLFGFLSKASLIVGCGVVAVALGAMTGYVSGSFAYSLLAAGSIALFVMTISLPAALLWWRLAQMPTSSP